ncbi:MAG: sodium:calcium antiporter [Candidatus Nanohaloarchaea archaeon]|nr:sodium:calcium antiporter [Candidatus Nanohaloarchaea archaeon]
MSLGLGLQAQLVLGFFSIIGLVFGAEKAVDKMTSIAAYYNIPNVVIAVSVISVGTSLPELASHVVASAEILAGTVDYEIASATVLGANIGSDVVQQTLVVGLVILGYILIQAKRKVDLNSPLPVIIKELTIAAAKTEFTFEKSFLKKDYLPMIGTTLMTLVLAWDGVLSRIDGLVLFSSFIGYMYYIYHTRQDRINEEHEASDNVRRDILVGTGALVLVLASSHIVLKVTETVVAATGLGASIIGVATIGVVSAFPELFTALAGLVHEAEDISLGTLIGSNITNPLLAIGLGSIISTYWVPRPLVLWDLPMETFTAAALLTYLLFISDRKLDWKGGVYLVCLYIFYLAVRYSFFAID